MPTIIMIQVIAAAAGRRAGATLAASRASSDVPAAPTPAPIMAKATTASAIPPDVAIIVVANAASVAPSASTAMPPTIHGVRRAPLSEPWPQRARDSWTT